MPTKRRTVYKLGKSSLSNLEGIHPDLAAVVRAAIKITKQDFTVFEGLRSREQALENVEKGVSWTTNSKHCAQKDGHGHAVDLVPYIDGKVVWDWPGCHKIAEAMRTAPNDLGVHLRWGGFWGRLTATSEDPEELYVAYVERKKRRGETPHPDGPHFEITKLAA